MRRIIWGALAGSGIYLGYDMMRNDIRKFVPGRMRKLRVRATQFERPAGFSVDKLLKGSFGVFYGGELMTMKIRFDAFAARLVKERRWHHSQVIRKLPDEIGRDRKGHLTGRGRNAWTGGIEVTFELSSFVKIVPWILGWGRRTRKSMPKGLVEEVKGEVAELGKMY